MAGCQLLQPLMLAGMLVLSTLSGTAKTIHQKFAYESDEVLLELVKKNPALIMEKDDALAH